MATALISCCAFIPLAVKSPLHTRHISQITVEVSVISSIIQSVCLLSKGRLKGRCGLEPQTNIFFHLRNRQNLVRIRFENIRYLPVNTVSHPSKPEPYVI